MTDDQAGRGPTEVFGPLAGGYARFRPGYPGELFDAVLARVGSLQGPTLDLASGTGAAICPLLDRAARVVAIEPNRSMLAEARSRLGERPGWLGAAVARAEALPIATGAAACVTVAQAFHWFEARSALDECARVLSPGGVLAVLWNVMVPDAFTDEVRELVTRYNPGFGRPVTRSMLGTPAALAAHPAFVVEPPAEFLHGRAMNEDDYVGYAFSWSYCGGALGPDRRAPFERELRSAIRRHHPTGEWHEELIAVAHFARRLAPK